MSSNRHLQAAGYSIASNILVQFFSKGFTFILGAITLKYLQSSALLGIINVRIALLYTTLQFLSREPFRRACLGEAAKSEAKTWRRIANTIWLGFPWSLLLSIPSAYIWKKRSPSSSDLIGTTSEDYQNAVLITCMAVIFEMLAEPCFIFAQAKAISDHNPRVEVLHVTLKCIMTTFVTVLESDGYRSGKSSNILTKVAICQLTASIISVIYSYYSICSRQRLTLKFFSPSFKISKNASDGARVVYKYLDASSLKLTCSFIYQTILKQFLTEGERYVMTFFNVISLSEQGVYDVINNLGSLVARLIFKPIEESGYSLFSQTVSRTELLDIRKFYRVQENLMFLVKSMLLIGLMVVTFGYNFVPLIVVYGGEKLNNSLAFNLMKWQIFYTPLLAVNGVTECFTFAIMDTPDIKRHNYFLILLSLIFLMSIYWTQSVLGSASFILANSIIMFLRIIVSYKLIENYFYKHGCKPKLMDALPDLTTLISLSGVFIFLNTSQYYLLDLAQPLSVVFGVILGGWCLIFIIHVIICHEEALVGFASKLFKLKTY